jgi:7-carboxy-7-deazaguanine synthase
MKISEVFPSISGEGITQGYQTVFVRFIGCNLNCAWCDTNYAKKGGKEMDISAVVKEIRSHEPIRHVFFTGGEPLLQQQEVESIVDLLEPYGYFFTVKTNGAVPVAPLMTIRPKVNFAVDVKMPSSQMQTRMEFENYLVLRETDELLYACADKEDFEYAIDHHRHILARYNCRAQPCFSPVWGGEEEFPRVGQKWFQEMADLFMKWGPYNGKYSLQLHKCIWGVNKRGV